MKTQLSLFVILSLCLATQAQSVPDQKQVVPGERIGRVFLGDSRAAVQRRLGKPSATSNLPGGLISELWQTPFVSETQRRPTLQVVYRGGVAVQIETSNPAFRSKSGLSIHSSIESWSKRLGKPSVSPDYYYPHNEAKGEGLTQQYFDWKRAGLALETAAGGDAVDSNALIVHRRGVAVVRDPGGVAVRTSN